MTRLSPIFLTLALAGCDLTASPSPATGEQPGGQQPGGQQPGGQQPGPTRPTGPTGPTGPQQPAGPNAALIMGRFAACMTADNWTATNMGLWATKGTRVGAQCQECHVDCQGGFCSRDNAGQVVNLNRQERFIYGYFTVEGNAVAPATARLNATTLTDPHFYLTGDAAYQALDAFVTATNQAVAAGNCPNQGFEPEGNPAGYYGDGEYYDPGDAGALGCQSGSSGGALPWVILSLFVMFIGLRPRRRVGRSH